MFEFNGCLKTLDAHLADKAFVNGFVVSKSDCGVMMKVMMTEVPKELIHVNRWLKQMGSYTFSEMK